MSNKYNIISSIDDWTPTDEVAKEKDRILQQLESQNNMNGHHSSTSSSFAYSSGAHQHVSGNLLERTKATKSILEKCCLALTQATESGEISN